MFTAMFKLRFTFVYSSIQLKVLPCLQIIIVWCLPYWQLCKDWSLTFFIYSALQIDIFTCTMLLSLQTHERYNVHSSLQTERSNLVFGSFYDEIEFCLQLSLNWGLLLFIALFKLGLNIVYSSVQIFTSHFRLIITLHMLEAQFKLRFTLFIALFKLRFNFVYSSI